MNQGAFHPEPAGDPQDGAAVIPEVTPEMMDEAAHRAAELADGVAHHTLSWHGSIQDEPAGAAEAAEERGRGPESAAGDSAREADAIMGAADSADEPPTLGRATAQAAVDGDDDLAAREADAAGAGLSDASDAFGQYNAKVFEVVRSSMASTTALFAALIQARSVPEAMALNADHLRRQVETLILQGRELATLAQRLALNTLQPPTRLDR